MSDPIFIASWQAAREAAAYGDLAAFRLHMAAAREQAAGARDDADSLYSHWRALAELAFDDLRIDEGFAIMESVFVHGFVQRQTVPSFPALAAMMKAHAEVIASSAAFHTELTAQPGVDSGADIELVGPMRLLCPGLLDHLNEHRVWRRVVTEILNIAKEKGLSAVLISDHVAPFRAPRPAGRTVVAFQAADRQDGVIDVSVNGGADRVRVETASADIVEVDTQNPATLKRVLSGLIFPAAEPVT